MQLKTGVDSISIARIRKSLGHPAFLEKTYSAGERAYMANKKDSAPTAAGHWAAKEAFVKAMGTGITTTALWEVGIDHSPGGAPFFVLTGWAAELATGWQLALSITHTEDTATAFVVAYREEQTA